MKNKFLSFMSVLLCVVCMSFALSACDLNIFTDNDNTDKKPTNTISANSLVFGYNVDRTKLNNYFIEKGTKTNDLDEVYCISNNLATIYYYSNEYKFSIMRKIKSTSTLGNAGYTYQWTCVFDIKLYDLFSNAIWAGQYEHTAINLNTLNVAAEYTAAFKFNINKFAEVNKLSDFASNTYNYSITYASNYASANRMFEHKIEGEKIYSQFQMCFDAIEIIFQSVSSETKLSSEYNADNYQDIDFSNVIFKSVSGYADGYTHSIFAKNIPNNVIVEYNGNEQSEIGKHIVTATFKDPKRNLLHTLSANIDIIDPLN